MGRSIHGVVMKTLAKRDQTKNIPQKVISENNTSGSVQGFTPNIVAINKTDPKVLRIWVGTEAEYAAIASPDTNTLYFCTA